MIIELSSFFDNPSLINFGPLKIQFYAVTWLLSALFIYLFLKSNKIILELGLHKEKVNDLVFLYGLFFGAMCGGRVGYMLFYGMDQLLENPLSLFYVWQGGLSFHGGLAGVVISLVIFCKKNKIPVICFPRGINKNYLQFAELVDPDCLSLDYEIEYFLIKVNYTKYLLLSTY